MRGRGLCRSRSGFRFTRTQPEIQGGSPTLQHCSHFRAERLDVLPRLLALALQVLIDRATVRLDLLLLYLCHVSAATDHGPSGFQPLCRRGNPCLRGQSTRRCVNSCHQSRVEGNRRFQRLHPRALAPCNGWAVPRAEVWFCRHERNVCAPGSCCKTLGGVYSLRPSQTPTRVRQGA